MSEMNDTKHIHSIVFLHSKIQGIPGNIKLADTHTYGKLHAILGSRFS